MCVSVVRCALLRSAAFYSYSLGAVALLLLMLLLVVALPAAAARVCACVCVYALALWLCVRAFCKLVCVDCRRLLLLLPAAWLIAHKRNF